MHRDTRVGHPGQPSVAQVMPPEMLVPEASHHLIPMGRVAKDSRGDPAAAGAGEQAPVIVAHHVQAGRDQLARLLDNRHLAGPLALCRFVDQATRAGRGLTADGPDPPGTVDIALANAGHLTDAHRRAAAKITTSPQPA